MPWRGMSDGRPGEGGGDGPRKARLGLRRGESVDVEEPMDEMDETERVGDFMAGLGFILCGLSGIRPGMQRERNKITAKSWTPQRR